MAQQGIIYRYLRADADHDVSADPFALSLDGITWVTAGVTFIAVGALPPRPAAVHAANPPDAGMTGYWWRTLTGPTTSFPLNTGRNIIHGRATDSPEEPHFAWTVTVAYGE